MKLFAKKKNQRIINLALAAVLVVSTLTASVPFLFANNANAVAGSVYSALPSADPLTGYASQPFQAQKVSEFGDYIKLAGTNRVLDTVTVTLDSYAAYSQWSGAGYSNAAGYNHDITLNVYDATSGEPSGAPIATTTQSVLVPWRPEGDSSCGDPYGYGINLWRDSGGTCRTNVAFNVPFDLSSQHVILPSNVIVTVAFNTESYGTHPLSVTGPYNALNVAVPNGNVATVGTDNDTAGAVINAKDNAAGAYVETSKQFNVLRTDTGWGANGTVGMQLTATPIPAPTNLKFNYKDAHEADQTIACGGIINSNKAKIWHESGSLNLNWTAPAGAVNGYQVYVTGPTGSYINYGDTNAWSWLQFTQGDGTYTYSVRANSAGGLSDPSADCSIVYDHAAPTLSSVTYGTKIVTNNVVLSGANTFTVNLNELHPKQTYVEVDVLNNGVWSKISGKQSVNIAANTATLTITSPLEYGKQYQLKISTDDLAGNHNGFSIPFTVDNVAPDVPNNLTWLDTNNHSAQNGFTNVQKGTLSWTDLTPTDVDHYVYKFWTNIPGYFEGPTNAWSTSDPQYITTSSTGGSIWTDFDNKQGTYYFCVEAVDAAGTPSGCSNTLAITYDAAAPTVTIDPLATTSVTTPTITGTVSEASTVVVTVNGIPYPTTFPTTGTWSITTNPITTDGSYTVSVVATDAAGNTTSPAVTDSLVIDTTGPTATVAGSSFTAGQPVVLTGTVGTDATAVNVAIVDANGNAVENGPVTVNGTTWSYTVASTLSVQTYTVFTRAYDALGNYTDALPALLKVNAPAGSNTTVTPTVTPLITPASAAAVLGATTATNDNGNANTDTAVKGASEQKIADAVNSDANKGTIFGLAWYWWILIIAALAAIAWFVIAAIRRRNTDEA